MWHPCGSHKQLQPFLSGRRVDFPQLLKTQISQGRWKIMSVWRQMTQKTVLITKNAFNNYFLRQCERGLILFRHLAVNLSDFNKRCLETSFRFTFRALANAFKIWKIINWSYWSYVFHSKLEGYGKGLKTTWDNPKELWTKKIVFEVLPNPFTRVTRI